LKHDENLKYEAVHLTLKVCLKLIWHSQSSMRPSKMVFENLERASISLLMLGA